MLGVKELLGCLIRSNGRKGGEVSEQIIGRKEIGELQGEKMGGASSIVLYRPAAGGPREQWRGRACPLVARL